MNLVQNKNHKHDALNEKNIPITDLEIKYLIESTCSEFVKEIKKEGK